MRAAIGKCRLKSPNAGDIVSILLEDQPGAMTQPRRTPAQPATRGSAVARLEVAACLS